MAITVEDFKKLVKFYNKKDHCVYCGGCRITHMLYDEESDWNRDEDRCSFVFEDDRYGTVYSLEDFAQSEWIVVKETNIDWRNHE